MKLTKLHRCEYCGKVATHNIRAEKGYCRYSCKDCWQRVKETAITDGVETVTILVQGYFEVRDEL